MANLQKHLRNTFLAGIVAAVPVAVTIFVVWYIESSTRFLSEQIVGVSVPFLGIVIAIVAIYAVGLLVRSLIGKVALKLLDASLSRVPGLKALYGAWKQIALTPGGGTGMFDKVVLVRDEAGIGWQIAFTNGTRLGPDAKLLCVFIPACPNPMNGRLYIVEADRCRETTIAAEEAFKVILSTGNYVPEGLVGVVA